MHLKFSVTGSTALGDTIMEHLGIAPNQTHWLNIMGSVYKLELPKEDIATVQEWEEHKQGAVLKNLISFILKDLKLKVSELNVKLVRSEEPSQNCIIKPMTSTRPSFMRHTKMDDIQSDDSALTVHGDVALNTPSISKQELQVMQQYPDEAPNNPSNIGTNVARPQKVNMVFS